ncbi:DoxX family protein [Pseudonocardia spinosispora]|uniref:DoxX family protein n=1 Tax=Pseudonocardia spinosispora TaxID=103441 RepID=UPI00040BB38B|nr:DoxX family protein [Pseudonocardia spinosispora]
MATSSAFSAKFFENRVTGRAAIANVVARVLAGLAFLPAGGMKFLDLDATAQGLVPLGLPAWPVLALLLGLVEVVGGLMLLAGLGTRLAALGLFIAMIGANIENAMVMPAALPVTLLLLVLTGYLLWAGPGPYAVDNKLAARAQPVQGAA